MRQFDPYEIDDLPKGPLVETRRPVTREEAEAGVRGREIITLLSKKVRVRWFSDDDVIAFPDTEGRLWEIGEWDDGGCFKRAFDPF